MKGLVKSLFYIYAGLCIFAYVLSCLSPFINPEHSSLVYFTGLGFPVIFINYLTVALILGVWKKRFVFLLLIIPGFLFGLNYLSTGSSHKTSGDEITLYSLNSHNETYLEANPEEYKNWMNYVKEEQNKPDIICLQEHHGIASEIFPGTKKYDSWSYKKSNLKITSKYKILGGGEVKDEKGLRFAIYADMVKGEDTIRVYTFHLFSNNISSILKHESEKESENPTRLLSGGKEMLPLIYDAAKRRAQQAKKLKWHAAASPYPVILCGDMNETAQSFTYHNIKNGYDDSFSAAKPGLHATFLKNPDWVRIDYVFCADRFDVVQHDVLPYRISDHRALKVVFDF